MTQFAPDGDPFASFNAELEQIKAKAEEVSERLRTATATKQSSDGAVSVTIGASGVLQDIKFGPKAYNRPPEALSALVMRLISGAQNEVSADLAGAFSGMVGEDSAAMSILDEFLPQGEDDEEAPEDDDPGRDYGATDEPVEENRATPPPPAQAPPPAPRRRPSRPRPDDDDEEDEIRPW